MENTLSIKETICESLSESLKLAKMAIEYEKGDDIEGTWKIKKGCLGLPAAIILCSIADAIGSYVLNNNDPKKHFEIICNKDFYEFDDINELNKDNYIDLLWSYRNHLTHNQIIREQFRIGVESLEKNKLFLINETDGRLVYFLQVDNFFYRSIDAIKVFTEKIDQYVKDISLPIKNSSAKLNTTFINNPKLSDKKPNSVTACCEEQKSLDSYRSSDIFK